jgi:AraC-like DNA-binding protein
MIKAYIFKRHEAARESPAGHEEAQLFVLTEGAVRFFTPRRTWIMTPGRLCWLPSDIPHGFASNGPIAGVGLKVDARLCEGLPDDVRLLAPDPFFTLVLHRLIDHPADFDGLWRVLRRAIAEASEDRLILPAPYSPPLARLAHGLMHNPADDRHIDRWAVEIGLSSRTLMRRLKAETGLSFAAWRQRLRLIHAVAAMQSGASATTAALDAGFASASAFSAAFRKHMGAAPTVYLKGQVRDES